MSKTIPKLNSRNRRAGPKNGHAITVAVPTKLDLGCGPRKALGFIGVDRLNLPGVDVVLDIIKDPWPWEDNSVEEVHCSHFMEHLDSMERCAFLNNLYRILKPGGKATIICPDWSSCRAYGDPTHKWPPVSQFLWYYLSKEWRMANAVHTDAQYLPGGFNCNFAVTWGWSIEPGIQAKNQEAQQYAILYYKEACQDMVATLVKA